MPRRAYEFVEHLPQEGGEKHMLVPRHSMAQVLMRVGIGDVVLKRPGI